MEFINKNRVFLFVFFVFLVCIGFFVNYNSLDPDFGWHVRTGQLILERGIPHQDWYSYTMPSFPWIDHEWLLDILIFKIYSLSNIHFLSLVFISLYTLSFFISKRKYHSFQVMLLPVFFGYFATIIFLGIRPQLLTILFFVILIKFINEFLENSSKIVYLTPLLFIIWTNLHGGFFLGLAILLLVVLLETFKKTRVLQKINMPFVNQLQIKEQPLFNIFTLLFILFLSFIATLINPYGWEIYTEIFRTIGDNYLRFHIGEWTTPLGSSALLIYIYIGLFSLLLFKFYRRFEFNNIIISLFFLLLSLSSARYFLIFVAFTIPMLSDGVTYLRENYNFENMFMPLPRGKKISFTTFLLMILIISSAISIYNFPEKLLSKTNNRYPEKAIPFLKTLPLSKNMFNHYNWGGYLIWKLPERKVFIDGRMPSWRQNGQFAFGDYVKISDAEDGFEKLIDKYNIKLFVLPKDKRSQLEKEQSNKKYNFFIEARSNQKQLDRFLCFLASCSKKNLYDELDRLGFKSIYQDTVTVILEK